jgi:hypothetical protein
VKFKVDENLPVEVADALRAAGHDAITVGEERLTGADDPDVAAVALREQRAIVTCDLDFADIRTYPPPHYRGIIVFRTALPGKRALLTLASQLVRYLPTERLPGTLWIVRPGHVRIT